MAVHPISWSNRVGEAHEKLVAGTYTLYDRSGKPQRCVRRIVCPSATNISLLWDSGDNDSAPGAVPAGTVLDGDFAKITCDATVLVQW